ncbi:GAF domain-containing protein [Paenibacillus macquariensis]|uniref:GAF domain-containing protein n=1 Tax=Paenibacillus macquariensis TaxID=948756 RepID=A0ABY1K8Q4_9BACL|nr:GAF domain-containing protein [Paenibacillus macquariensis]MEC0093307.1 GAF domain-containing protein [Paenibacillus macquariensis]OAB27535.1 GAF domain-containing protein [Paenibacillus macquariensis subsp. macquariensis]SIR41648.1 GAF domain-containing protein [Paenibacillus macquariensis]
MFQAIPYEGDRSSSYTAVLEQLKSLIHDEPNSIANLANASALLNLFMNDINWVGFYIYDGKELVLGPFQGLPACIRIPLNRGVCGGAASQMRTLVVDDVHAFPGHIACDGATNSEIVVPIIKDGELYGVLDVDSPLKNRFDSEDQHFLEKFVEILTAQLSS